MIPEYSEAGNGASTRRIVPGEEPSVTRSETRQSFWELPACGHRMVHHEGDWAGIGVGNDGLPERHNMRLFTVFNLA